MQILCTLAKTLIQQVFNYKGTNNCSHSKTTLNKKLTTPVLI